MGDKTVGKMMQKMKKHGSKGNGKLLFNGYRVSVEDGEKVPEIINADKCHPRVFGGSISMKGFGEIQKLFCWAHLSEVLLNVLI